MFLTFPFIDQAITLIVNLPTGDRTGNIPAWEIGCLVRCACAGRPVTSSRTPHPLNRLLVTKPVKVPNKQLKNGCCCQCHSEVNQPIAYAMPCHLPRKERLDGC